MVWCGIFHANVRSYRCIQVKAGDRVGSKGLLNRNMVEFKINK